ncbi:hypothetical protein G7Y79_00018g045290 [Physcia stellaris]|nr:hypothetical protein G7Y79_00018g045290 [Physcia stellaris]
MDKSSFCRECRNFDIRAVYELAYKRSQNSRLLKSTEGGFPIYEGFPTFFKQHTSLQALFHAVQEGCLLCTAIWQQSLKQIPQLITFQTKNHVWDEYDEPVHLGLSDWTPEADGMPYLIAVQHLPRGAMRNLASFEVYVDSEDGPFEFGQLLARAVQSDPASEPSIKIMQSWHYDCLENHTECARTLTQKRPLPTRVVDVGDTTAKPRLFATDGMVDKWAALSYCWGGKSSFVLNKDTSTGLFGGHIPLAEYPQTLQDAIIITRLLKIRYLWIDAICIMQDSHDDWSAEAARMKDVYGGALITIAATCSRSTDDGIFKPRKTSEPACSLEWRIPDVLEPHTVFLRSSSGGHLWDTAMKSEPLNTRGWTLQESLLAPRTLSYGTQQMFWECLCLKTSESGRPVLPGERHRDKAFVQSIISNKFDVWKKSKLILTRTALTVPRAWEDQYFAMYSRWYAIVRDFTGRNLTVQTDVLPALSGIAAAFQNLLQDDYCAGLWRHDIVRGLCWTRDVFPKMLSNGQEQKDANLPSWSWASVARGRFHNLLGEDSQWPFIGLEESAVVVDVRTKSRFADIFGQVSGGYLTIRAPFCLIEDPRLRETGEHATANPVLNSKVRKYLSIRGPKEEFKQQHQAHNEQRFAVIRLMRTSRSSVSEITGIETYRPGAEILILESTEAEKSIFRRAKHGEEKARKELWRRIAFMPISVPFEPDDEDSNVLFLDEMNKAKWKWTDVTII